MSRNTAHKQSQAHQEYVTNLQGRKMRNTACNLKATRIQLENQPGGSTSNYLADTGAEAARDSASASSSNLYADAEYYAESFYDTCNTMRQSGITPDPARLIVAGDFVDVISKLDYQEASKLLEYFGVDSYSVNSSYEESYKSDKTKNQSLCLRGSDDMVLPKKVTTKEGKPDPKNSPDWTIDTTIMEFDNDSQDGINRVEFSVSDDFLAVESTRNNGDKYSRFIKPGGGSGTSETIRVNGRTVQEKRYLPPGKNPEGIPVGKNGEKADEIIPVDYKSYQALYRWDKGKGLSVLWFEQDDNGEQHTYQERYVLREQGGKKVAVPESKIDTFLRIFDN